MLSKWNSSKDFYFSYIIFTFVSKFTQLVKILFKTKLNYFFYLFYFILYIFILGKWMMKMKCCMENQVEEVNKMILLINLQKRRYLGNSQYFCYYYIFICFVYIDSANLYFLFVLIWKITFLQCFIYFIIYSFVKS